jgi:general secretion pathway protein D
MEVAGKDVSITADISTNSLVIFAKPDEYHAIEEMIRKLDIPRKQVFIEALAMEVSPDEQFQFGTEWEGLKDVGHPFTDQANTGVIGGSKVEQSALDQLFGGGVQALGAGLTLGMIGETINIGDYTFPSLSFLIRAVDSVSTLNVLSKPQLLTLNNRTAKINISENRPFQTSETQLEGGGTSQNIEYRDVGIKLEITPHINKAGKIRLEILQEVDRVSDLVTATQPVTRKRAIDTVVEVQDGHTVVIGGLIEQQQDFSRGQVPCLGGLKFFGWAFKNINVSDNRTNLLVFISPHIVGSAKDADSLTIQKMEHMEKERTRFHQEVESEEPWFMKHAPKKEQPAEQEEEK